MDEEVSKNTIIVLVILTVVISVLGTWTVMNEIKSVKMTEGAPASQEGYRTTGRVSISINAPGETPDEGVFGGTGKVTLSIVS